MLAPIRQKKYIGIMLVLTHNRIIYMLITYVKIHNNILGRFVIGNKMM